jgi:predicted O-linked N-acetylglucosamine transferase (SPINDLY family)
VAYVSADFYNHPLSYLAAGLFEKHDRSRFEISAIYFGPDQRDEMRERLERSVERFVDVRTSSDREVAELLKGLEIEIAVDLKALTEDCRPGILASRPAPLQVNYLGYPGTMAAPYIDYLIADAHVIPEAERACYAERIVYLPDAYQVNDSARLVAESTPQRAEVDLPQAGFVFCCFNNNYKISPAIFDLWMRLLQKVDGSVLWLVADNATALRNLRREAERRQVAPERLVFAERAKVDEYRARYRLADLFLDTLPYNAHTTASDALWVGLPVLTCTGHTFAGRVGGSLLAAAGLPELVTETLEEYEALALKLATTPAMLADLKARLMRNRDTCALFDTDRFRRHIESAYVTMWTRYQRGEPPQDFAVRATG